MMMNLNLVEFSAADNHQIQFCWTNVEKLTTELLHHCSSPSSYVGICLPSAGVAFATAAHACVQSNRPFIPLKNDTVASVPISTFIVDSSKYSTTTNIEHSTILLSKNGSVVENVICKSDSTTTSSSTSSPSPFIYAISRSGTSSNSPLSSTTLIQVGKDGLLEHLDEVARVVNILNTDTVLWSTPTTFDPSLVELFGYGRRARKLVVAGASFDPGFLRRLIVTQDITVIHMTPSAFLLLQEDDECSGSWLNSVRTVVFGGEPLPPFLVELLLHRQQQLTVYNLYGLTELSVWQCWSKNDCSIGTPFSDVDMQVRADGDGDDDGSQCVSGQIGQVWIRSSVRWTSAIPQATWFPTGDLVSVTNDDRLMFVRRNDSLIKVHGQIVDVSRCSALVKKVADAANAETVQSQEDGSLTSFVLLTSNMACRCGHRAASADEYHRCTHLEFKVSGCCEEEIIIPRRIIVIHDIKRVLSANFKVNLKKLHQIALQFIMLERKINRDDDGDDEVDEKELELIVKNMIDRNTCSWSSFTVARLASVISHQMAGISFADVINICHGSATTTADSLIEQLIAKKNKRQKKILSMASVPVARSVLFGACVDGPVHVTEDGHVYVGAHDHTVRCVDGPKFSFVYDAGAPVDSELFFVNNSFIVVLPLDGTMHCLSLDGRKMGPALTLPSQGKGVCCLPTDPDDTTSSFVIACLSGHVLTFSILSSQQGRSKLEQTVMVGAEYEKTRLTGSPVLMQSRCLCVPASDGFVYTIVGDRVGARLRVSDQPLYAGLLRNGSQFIIAPTLEGSIICLSVGKNCDMAVRWKSSQQDRIPLLSLPAVRPGKLFFLNQLRHIFCLDSEFGSFLWSFNASPSLSLNVKTRPIIDDSTTDEQVVVVGCDRLSTHSCVDGSLIKEWALPALCFSSPGYDAATRSVWFGCRNDSVINVQL